ncbi:hypothetical protein LWI28_005076 [Acer negundo]|uniref:DUF7950 domain-containing protein n=1 Tax=Acer negundo TaxID=4023 RepID=A0AAD5ISU5_ACENE|nr:hypothetical protein LWI28_005076 [Acer negundo]KAK4847250.1 hypothetical protein QYF36_027526 [Acer negundo]
MDRIMLRFRPIAPKPVGGGGSDSKNVLVNNKRCKRKYVRVSRNNSGYGRKKKTTLTQVDGTGSEDGTDNKMVTLQLLPERADSISEDPIPTSRTTSSRCNNYLDDNKTWELEKNLQKNNQAVFDNCMVGLGVTTSSEQTVAVETLVTVESVSTADTTTFNNNMDFRGIGSSGRLEIMMRLERDTCPAFISDGLNRIQWVNGAYKRMVMVRLLEMQDQQTSAAETAVTVLVSLLMKDNYKLLTLPSSFTCKVRVEYRWQKETEYSKMMVVPCDVWRIMDLVGGFAWRLDVQAALSLGR